MTYSYCGHTFVVVIPIKTQWNSQNGLYLQPHQLFHLDMFKGAQPNRHLCFGFMRIFIW